MIAGEDIDFLTPLACWVDSKINSNDTKAPRQKNLEAGSWRLVKLVMYTGYRWWMPLITAFAIALYCSRLTDSQWLVYSRYSKIFVINKQFFFSKRERNSFLLLVCFILKHGASFLALSLIGILNE